MEWNEKVIMLMNQKMWNQKDLARESGITESSVSRYLNGERTPRIDIINNFSKVLGVSVDYLLCENSDETNGYNNIAEAIARNGRNLTAEEKNRLIQLILLDSERANV